MDHNSIIDRETFEVFEHAEDYPKAFICDKRIAPSIALLNKKGYKTIASCSGHYRLEWNEQNKTLIYILFDKEYKFNSIPNGFEIMLTDGKTQIESFINLTIENKLRNRMEFERELDIKCQILNDWVEKLPVSIERNDE